MAAATTTMASDSWGCSCVLNLFLLALRRPPLPSERPATRYLSRRGLSLLLLFYRPPPLPLLCLSPFPSVALLRYQFSPSCPHVYDFFSLRLSFYRSSFSSENIMPRFLSLHRSSTLHEYVRTVRVYICVPAVNIYCISLAYHVRASITSYPTHSAIAKLQKDLVALFVRNNEHSLFSNDRESRSKSLRLKINNKIFKKSFFEPFYRSFPEGSPLSIDSAAFGSLCIVSYILQPFVSCSGWPEALGMSGA